MKNKTFFYKFNRDINVHSATNHGFIVEENEARDSLVKIAKLLENEPSILNKIDIVKEGIDSYYGNRLEGKRLFIAQHPELISIADQFDQIGHYIVTVRFNKILSSNEIRLFLESMWADVFRIFSYDSAVEIIVNKRVGFFDEFKDLIRRESLSMQNYLTNQDSIDFQKYLFTIDDLSIDSANRPELLSFQSESTPKKVLVKINQKYFSRKEFDSLRAVYLIYKNDDSDVSVQNIEDDGFKYLLFSFTNLDTKFYDAIVTLFEAIVSIEPIEGHNNYVQGDRVDQIEQTPYTADDVNDLPTVCIVDARVNSTSHPYLNQLVEYWSSIDSVGGSSHGTQVAILAAYGKLSWPILEKPQCKIYSIEACNSSYSNIKDIIDEAVRKNIKIINISQGADGYLKDNQWISELAKSIDRELVNKDILLILSAWNIEPEKTNLSLLRNEDANINIPKDAVSCIVVWAKNRSGKPALYSRKNNVVPIIVGDMDTRLLRLKDKKNPAFIDSWDNVTYWWDFWSNSSGTSFAAPLLCNKAVQIFRNYWDISTNTIKALFINYSSREHHQWLYTVWPSDDLCNRHIWWWIVQIDHIVADDNRYVNIVIEDYISENEKKRYPIVFPNIGTNSSVEIRTALSYNSPVSSNFHLKYIKFNVAARLWSKTYEEVKRAIFDDASHTREQQMVIWKEYKESHNIRWLNYFWTNQMWSANTGKKQTYEYPTYSALQNETEIVIEGHSRDGMIHNQKFSFVLTIDISTLNDANSYIDQFLRLNNQIISGLDEASIRTNIQNKELEFARINDIQISVEEIRFD